MTDTVPAPPTPTLTPIPRRGPVWIVLQFLMRIVLTLFCRQRVRGLRNLPDAGGGLMLINHQSFLDPVVVAIALRRPVSFVARDSLFRVPVIGWILRNTYVIPINREAASGGTMRAAISRMQDGFLVGVFPEGTRSEDGSLLELQPGFIALARRGNLPIFPVGISGAQNVMPRNRPGIYFRDIRVVYGEPIDADEVARLARKGNEAELLAVVTARLKECHAAADRWLRKDF